MQSPSLSPNVASKLGRLEASLCLLNEERSGPKEDKEPILSPSSLPLPPPPSLLPSFSLLYSTYLLPNLSKLGALPPPLSLLSLLFGTLAKFFLY
jgi:hypothetical protein